MPMPLTPADRARLVEALLECDCMKAVNARNAVVWDLPAEVQQRLQAGGTTKQDVDEIVRVCAQFPGALDTLLQRVRFFEGPSFAWQKLEQVAHDVLSAQAAPPPVAAGASPAPPATGEPIHVFFSYSHADEALRDELSKHLSLLERQGVIHKWHDRQIPPGSEWAQAIDDRLDRAQVILLLVSSDFLASDYCHEIEMKRALERHDRGEAVVIPIILRPCEWQGAMFGKLQALPKDARPVAKWADKDDAFTDVARGIRRAIENLRNRSGA
jgi:hypothetical protein